MDSGVMVDKDKLMEIRKIPGGVGDSPERHSVGSPKSLNSKEHR
jgi:hypothetical protein